ncbi:MAG: hypothetical protein SFZ23_09880 [Planctomycetota bacterium]|nr:hypothetical protein [Planctomycetota bacterium]
MHDSAASGNEFFKCDFCAQPWSEDRPMVEGHRGSLICGSCLRVAWLHVTGLHATGPNGAANAGPMSDEASCALCLMHKREPAWQSPSTEAWACRWCLTKSAEMLERDPDVAWTRPEAAAGTGQAGPASSGPA